MAVDIVLTGLAVTTNTRVSGCRAVYAILMTTKVLPSLEGVSAASNVTDVYSIMCALMAPRV